MQLIFFLLIYPHSHLLWQCCYLAANGPLLGAVMAWRNSLVFHDIDRIFSSISPFTLTFYLFFSLLHSFFFPSVILHTFPALITYSLRWNNTSHSSITRDPYISPFPPFSEITANSSSFFDAAKLLFSALLLWFQKGYWLLRPFLVNMGCYMVWLLAYCMKVLLVDASYLKTHKELEYSERWIGNRLKPV